MEKYDFTMQHLYGENHHHITKIINILQASNLEEVFIRKFYATIPMLNLTGNDYKLYADLVRNAFNFLQKHDVSKSKVKLYKESRKSSEGDHTVIEILSRDMPFVFDSAMCLLNKLNICVERAAHPTIFVSRDKNGKLLSIDEVLSNGGEEEIVIQILTSHALENELATKVEAELNSILSFVEAAVYDWRKTLDKLQLHINDFDKACNIENINLHCEQKEFLENMRDKYFVFLGAIQYSFNKDKKAKIKDSTLGILKLDLDQFEPLIETSVFTSNFCKDTNLISISKLNKSSVVHRDVSLDCLCVKTLDEKGNIKTASIFIGLFTSILYYQSATLIPIIRDKLSFVLKKANFRPHSYAGKELVSIVEALPRDELFEISSEELFPLVMEIYALLFATELRLFLRKKGGHLSCLLFLPTELANTENVKKLKANLTFEYGPIVSHSFAQINSSKLCYYHFIIDSKDTILNTTDLTQIEKDLRSVTRPWDISLKKLLLKEYSKHKAMDIFNKFQLAFSVSYQEKASYSQSIIQDIKNVSAVIDTQEIIFKISPNIEGKANLAQLKIYHLEELNLSAIMPMLQNMGLNVVAEQIHVIEPLGNKGEVWLHQFVLKADKETAKMIEDAQENIEEAFHAMWHNKCQNDPYNQLILKANLTHRQVTMLMGLSEYLCQVKIGYSHEYLGQILNKHSKISKLLVDLFYSMFNNKLTSEERLTKSDLTRATIEKELDLIHDNVEDQIIRRFINVLNNILRTNYFLRDKNNHEKDYMSFKIDSAKIINIPLPSPYREIFVYSANFEAIHLRGGKVARGGLRWSDRSEDYRTEVLGLMKTQVVKNAVIVPTGSKGGFVLKNTAGLSREEFMAKGKECYKNFLRGMLDITDNMVEGRIHHPKHIVRYDQDDAYLVVAADKGTATFSDIANSISDEYKFWLGDAFASGGSKGYDHKKMAITARGAWISVARHFREIGVDVDKDDFTVVGIGDMSGDVFGNGMLLSKHIKLLAAFNHMHIFIDPNPNSAKSFLERERLFNLPRSTWEDYSSKVLSKGARVYSRNEKSLQLTPEIKERFNIKCDNISPINLMRILLTAEVDLLWNGGIGTYAKAKFETHEQVGDKANDNLRCNGEDLRCKIIGEGGNLGFTQHARIEYARKGGRINTDAIDNSAGVDCSDHEVNLKIALKELMNKGLMTEDERVSLLESMTDDIAELCLKDNRTQTRALTIASQQGIDVLGSQEHFINLLEEQGILDRELECLPSRQQFTQLYASKQGLTRPELSVLLAYSKNAIYDNLINTNLAEDPYFCNDLLLYFPEKMRKKYSEILISHPLRKEIITTSITNSMVNRVDTFYLHLAVESTGHKFSDIARAYTVTRDVFGLRELWKEINKLDGIVKVKDQVELSIVIKKFVMRSTSWLLRNYHHKINIAQAIEEYQAQVKKLKKNIGSYLVNNFKESFEEDLEEFKSMNVPEELAHKIALLGPLSSAYNIAEISNRKKVPVDKVCKIYFELGYRFNVDWLRHVSRRLVGENNWQKLAIQGFKDELYDTHRKIVASAVESAEKHDHKLDHWYKANDKQIKLFDRFIAEVKSQGEVEYAMMELSLKKLGNLLAK